MYEEKSWIPLGRRSEQAPSLVECYTEVFDALVWANDLMPVPCVDTILFTHNGVRYYSYDWSQRCVLLLHNLNTPALAIRAFMSMDEGNAISAVWHSEVKDAQGIVLTAEYLTLNALSTFFTVNEGIRRTGVLQRFVFPRPFRHIDEIAQEVLVSYSPATENCQVERRLGTIPMDRTDFPATVRGNLFHPILMSGKYHTLTPPLTAADCAYGAKQMGERITTKPAFQELCRKFAAYMSRALMHGRRVKREHDTQQRWSGANAPPVRPVSNFVAQLRQNFHDGQLYFISLLSLRHPADRYHPDMQYELIKIPSQDQVTYTTTPFSTGELEVPVLSAAQVDAYTLPSARRTSPLRKRSASTSPKQSPLRSPQDGSTNIPTASGTKHDAHEDDGDEEEEEEEPEDPRVVGGSHWRPAAPDMYACPNCDKTFHKDSMVRLDYAEILEAFAKRCNEEADKQQQPRRAGGDSAAASGRPMTARATGRCNEPNNSPRSLARPLAATSTAAVRGRPQSAGWSARNAASPLLLQTVPTAGSSTAPVSCTAVERALARGTLIHPVVEIPLVLRRLSMPLTELPGHPVRLQRSTPLCEACAGLFGVTVAHQAEAAGNSAAAAAVPQPEGDRTNRATSPRVGKQRRETMTAAAVQAALASIPQPSCLQSDVLDTMVVSDLQAQHRLIRQAERKHFLAQQAGAREAVERQSQRETQQDDTVVQMELDALLEALSVHERIAAPIAAVSPNKMSPSFPKLLQPTSSSSSSGAAVINAASPSSSSKTIEVLGPGPDVPLSILLMNDLYYRMEDVLRGGTGTLGGSELQSLEASGSLPRPPLLASPSRKKSALMAPLPRPPIVVPEDDLAPATSKHRSRVEREVRREGTRKGLKTLAAGSRTAQELSRPEQKLLLTIVGSDANSLPMDD